MNAETTMTLDDAVAEVLGLLTGLDLQYTAESDRYQTITRQLNRALRAVAHEKEWSYFADVASLGTVTAGDREVHLPSSLRPRVISDDSVRLVDSCGAPKVWAYFLPRDALHKYAHANGLWCSVTRQTLVFSRPFHPGEDGLEIQLPVMREPTMFRLPPTPEDPYEDRPVVPEEIRQQPLDFVYPDLIVLRAAFYYAQTDPVMQPRVQTIEAQYKDMMYQIVERDDRHTDTPFINSFTLPIQAGVSPGPEPRHGHPHQDWM